MTFIIIINVEKTSDALLSLQTVIMQVNYLAYVCIRINSKDKRKKNESVKVNSKATFITKHTHINPCGII